MTETRRAEEPLIQGLKWTIRMAVRLLAILMTGVVLLGVVDVGWTLHQRAMSPPFAEARSA